MLAGQKLVCFQFLRWAVVIYADDIGLRVGFGRFAKLFKCCFPPAVGPEREAEVVMHFCVVGL